VDHVARADLVEQFLVAPSIDPLSDKNRDVEPEVNLFLKDLSGMTAAKTYGYFLGNPAKSNAANAIVKSLFFVFMVCLIS
jgi:hypothetical protein